MRLVCLVSLEEQFNLSESGCKKMFSDSNNIEGDTDVVGQFRSTLQSSAKH